MQIHTHPSRSPPPPLSPSGLTEMQERNPGEKDQIRHKQHLTSHGPPTIPSRNSYRACPRFTRVSCVFTHIVSFFFFSFRFAKNMTIPIFYLSIPRSRFPLLPLTSQINSPSIMYPWRSLKNMCVQLNQKETKKETCSFLVHAPICSRLLPSTLSIVGPPFAKW